MYSEVGKGSLFNIYLPAFSKCIEKCEYKKKSQHQGGGRILIMDDQESILKMASRLLNSMGYETISTKDGVQAIKVYSEAYQSKESFDAVILDLTVPGGMGGVKTIPELLKIDPKDTALVNLIEKAKYIEAHSLEK